MDPEPASKVFGELFSINAVEKREDAMWKYLPFTFKNALRNRRRTVLTVLSVSVSLFLLGTLIAVYFAFYHREGPPEAALRAAVHHRVSLAFALPEFYAARIQQIPGVKEVCRASWYGGVYIDHRPRNNFARFAVDADKIFPIRPELRVDPGQRAAFERERTAAAVGRSIAEPLGLKLGQRITLQGDIYPGNLELVIRAIFEGENDAVMYFHRDYLEESLPPARRGWTGMILVLTDSAEAVPRVSNAVDEMFRNSPQQTKTESERAFQLSFVSLLGNIKLILLGICSAVTFAILLVSANTMAMSVRERISEVGVLRTLGFTSEKVLAMIMAEAVMMALAGGLIGSFLAMGMVQWVSKMPIFFVQGMHMPPAALGISLGVALLIGLASSLIPALSAARMPVTEALRHTG
ncbi:MAG TPA: ABC transporter permease [Bryobacterales bacterium]|jgi:putative ABC transport system permease protein|nr:ABC transporter permease [Bryobacterales bacterium]